MDRKKEFLLTKIIATPGPASASPAVIEKMIQEGVRVFRINFSHGTFDQYETLLERVRAASARLDIPVGVLGDLAGPKIRVGQVVDGGVELIRGQRVEFQTDALVTLPPEQPDGPVVFSTTWPDFISEVQPGETILLDDGYVRLRCLEQQGDRLVCEVVDGGRITSGKGVNLPDTALSGPALTDKDLACVEFAVARGFDYLALSFVRGSDDVRQLKAKLRELGARPGAHFPYSENQLEFSTVEVESESTIPVISKIEKPQAVVNLIDILRETDAVMIARGDLGVEMDLAEVAVTQKRIITL
ncbi:hypothetical protein JXA02_06675, partial [candidate division KSB1 bacterium]|nr:hypothetical protein [candidate division KSB1 bacterium]